MDEFGQQVKQRLHVEVGGAEPSPAFWDQLEARRAVHGRRRIVGRIAAVAASVAVLGVAGFALQDQLASGPQVPSVASQPGGLPIPSSPTRVADGLLESGASWTLDVSGPNTWREAPGEEGDVCVRIAISDGGSTVNCHPLESTLRIFDSSLYPLVAVRNQPQAHRLEFRYDDGRAQSVPTRLYSSDYGLTWSIADPSATPRDQLFEGLTEVAVLDAQGDELIAGKADGSRSPASPEPED
jgi:hypothetical protein